MSTENILPSILVGSVVATVSAYKLYQKPKITELQSSSAAEFISATGSQALTHLQSAQNIETAGFVAGAGLLVGTDTP